MKKTLTVLLAMMLVMTLLPMTAGAEEKKYDLGGRVVTIASWTDGTPNPNSDTYAEQMELLEHINEKYNCDLQFVTTGDWHSYMSVINAQVVNGEKIDTPPKELELLFHLASFPNRVFTRNQLLDEVWGFDYFGDSRTVDVHIKRLREKLEGVSEQWSLKTVWGVGYKFEVL